VFIRKKKEEEKQFFSTIEKRTYLLFLSLSLCFLRDWLLYFKRYDPLTNCKREREKKKEKIYFSYSKQTTEYGRWVRADARCVDETTIGMLFIRSGHDWMMKRCGRSIRKMVDDRSFSSFSALSAWQMQMDPSF
jgi:hypothetical protein